MTPAQMARLHGEAFASGWSEATFKELCADPRTTLVSSRHGFALAQGVLDEADLLTIIVAPQGRGRRDGARLLTELTDRLCHQGIKRLFLEVAADNHAARALYRRAGFEQDGLRRGYYPRPGGAVDALLMSRAL